MQNNGYLKVQYSVPQKDRKVDGLETDCQIHHLSILSKEVWKILPSYEELRRGAIGRGKEVEVMSIRCHVN